MNILVVDDDEVMRRLLCEVLVKEGYLVELASSGEEALKKIRERSFPLILSDIRLSHAKLTDLDGVGLLREIKKFSKSSVVILMTGFGSMEGTLQAIQEGAFDYVSKPFKMDELKNIVARGVKYWETLRAQGFVPRTSQGVAQKVLIGKSPRIVEVYKILARAAMSASNVLLIGENGTGKDLVAHAIHENSERRNKPFISIDCAMLSEQQVDAVFAQAQGGTLFLEEVCQLAIPVQARMLRIIQEGEQASDLRVIAATAFDIENSVKSGKFREDLYYRLNVIRIELPALRERVADLPELIDHFVARYAEKNKKPVSHVSPETMELLRRYRWPGNVRELERAVERAVAMTHGSVLLPDDFPLGTSISINGSESPTSLEELERVHILRVLQEVRYNKSKASEVLGIDRATLYRKAQRYGIELRGK